MWQHRLQAKTSAAGEVQSQLASMSRQLQELHVLREDVLGELVRMHACIAKNAIILRLAMHWC